MTKEMFNGDELASNVWKSKYAYESEKHYDEMHMRMAKEFARADSSYDRNVDTSDLSDYGKVLHKEYSELDQDGLTNRYYELFKDFKYIVPQGSIMATLGTPTIASLSNCFVLGSPENSYGGILRLDEEQIQLMKRRGGVGIDISSLQPSETPVNNAAKTSTGAVSFMERYSNSTREVAQNGRRGALMLSIDISHPDSLDFIKAKRDLTKITGANISVKLCDEFMEAVVSNHDYYLKYPIDAILPKIDKDINYNTLYPAESLDGKTAYVKKVKAKEYWGEIIKSAHTSAEPGILFWDAITDYSPDSVYPQYKQITTNPCSEIAMQSFDACRLMVTNLYSFVDNPFTDKAEFNFEKFYKVNYESMRLMDNLIDLEVEHIKRIIEKIESDPESDYTKSRELGLWHRVMSTAVASRRTGLGFTALGDMLAALNISYNSNDAISFTKKVMHEKMKSELDCTIDMSITRGSFEGWNNSKEFSTALDFSNNVILEGSNSFYDFLTRTYPNQVKKMYKYGRRNLSFSTVAPTGSVSLLTQTTSGIEPLFMPYYMRRKKVNASDIDARIDFIDGVGDSWQEFPVMHEKFKDWACISKGISSRKLSLYTESELKLLFEQSPWFSSTANDIEWSLRVDMQSVIQKYTTHSISSTVNLPRDVSEEEVSNIYLSAWSKKLKGITVYRDGSRDGVLITNESKSTKLKHTTAPKRPKSLVCEVHSTVSKGIKYNVFVGLLEGEPYEVFLTEYFTNEPTLNLKKIKKGRYDLYKGKEVYSEDISSNMTDEQEAITRLVSTSLRHGAEIKFVVEQLQKTSSDDMFSFTKSLARVLKKYIPNGAKSTIVCSECGSKEVIFEEGCSKCLNCGHSACS